MNLIYLDASHLTFLAKNRDIARKHSEFGFAFAYSPATLMDLKSAKFQELELSFLSDFQAYYLHEMDGQLVGTICDPFEKFAQEDRVFPQIMGQLINRMVGGGSVQSDRDFFSNLLGVGLNSSMIELLLTEQDYPDVGKSAYQKSFEKMPKMMSGENLSEFLGRQDSNAYRGLIQVFPEKVPESSDARALSALLLNFIVPTPAKGIRSEKPEPSERESVDSLHIAYGLGCCAFLTHDRATHEKYNLLANYWMTKGEAHLFTKHAILECK